MEEVKNKSVDLIQELDAHIIKSYQDYYQANEDLKKFGARILKGDELKEAEELAIKMEMIFRYEIEPIGKFISLRSGDIIKMSHNHQEWRAANIKANEKPSILDPNLVN